MKKNFLGVFLFCSLSVNVALLWKLTQNSSEPLPNWSTDDLNPTPRSAEELSFIREFLSRNHTFQSSSYLSSQASLLTWLSPSIADEKKAEIQRISKKIQDQNVDQSAQLMKLEQMEDGTFQSVNSVVLNEGKNQTQFFVRDSVNVSPASRSTDNVWGFLVTKIDSTVISDHAATTDLRMMPGKMSLLQFPCQAKNIAELGTPKVKMKVVTTKTSEISLIADPDWVDSFQLHVSCEAKEFRLQVSHGYPNVRFLKIEDSQGTLIPLAQKRIPKERNLIRKSLENELGFVIEESDK